MQWSIDWPFMHFTMSKSAIRNLLGVCREVKLLSQAYGQKQSVMVDHCLCIPDRKLTNTSRMSMNPITSVQSSGASDSEQATTGALKIFCADRTCKATRLSAEGSQCSNMFKDDLTRLSTFSA